MAKHFSNKVNFILFVYFALAFKLVYLIILSPDTVGRARDVKLYKKYITNSPDLCQYY